MFTGKVGKDWNMLPREAAESPFLEIFHNPVGQDPEQHTLSSLLASVWTGGLYRQLPELHSRLHFSVTPWLFSKAYGHLIPLTVVNPAHIAFSQWHILIHRGQGAWENSFFTVVGFWNLIWLMCALCQAIQCKLWIKFLQLCLWEQINHQWGLLRLYNWTRYTIIFLARCLAYFWFTLKSILLHQPQKISDINSEMGRSYQFFLPVVSLFWDLVKLTVWILAVSWPKCHQVALDVF